MLHVYAIIDGDAIRGAVPPGHDGEPVAAFPADGFAAVVSAAKGMETAPTVKDVWQHDDVLSALLEEHAVVPLRFGTISDRDALRTLLNRRRQRTHRDLERVRGKVELALRLSKTADGEGETALAPRVATVEPGSGKAYLMARVANRHGGSAVSCAAIRHIRDRVDRLAAETTWNDAAWPVKASCLIARPKVSDFIATAERLVEQHSDIGMSCTGPWAPYSFVGAFDACGGAP